MIKKLLLLIFRPAYRCEVYGHRPVIKPIRRLEYPSRHGGPSHVDRVLLWGTTCSRCGRHLSVVEGVRFSVALSALKLKTTRLAELCQRGHIDA